VTNLTIDDIVDARAYERDREATRERVMALKRLRRVAVGDIVTFVFENRETIRFQVQEMARAEKIQTDAGIQTELDTYNTLIPATGQLSATMFIELTSEEQLRHWLPRLVGVERCLALVLGDGRTVRAVVEEQHAEQLTRDDITSSVHYVRFELSDDEIALFQHEPVRLQIDHSSLQVAAVLRSETVQELSNDLLGVRPKFL
jgi:Protein of unknown function (DUF3501)